MKISDEDKQKLKKIFNTKIKDLKKLKEAGKKVEGFDVSDVNEEIRRTKEMLKALD